MEEISQKYNKITQECLNITLLKIFEDLAFNLTGRKYRIKEPQNKNFEKKRENISKNEN